MEFIEVIKRRRTVREMKDTPIPEDTIKKIIEAGISAPTYDHMREWEFIVLQDKEDKKNALQFVKGGAEINRKTWELLYRHLLSRPCFNTPCPDSILC